MSELKIRIKIADYEFEADGLNDVVRAELAGFKKLLPAEMRAILPNESYPDAPPAAHLGKILRVDRRVVSLKVQSESVEEAVLVLLFGQKHFRNNDRVTGSEIMDGLRASGQRVNRIDYVLTRHSADGRVTAMGKGRSRRYKLTNRGVQKAQEIARKLSALPAPENQK